MRKIKVNYQQLLDAISCHLNAIDAIANNEHIELTPLVLDKNGLITVYVYKNIKG